MESEIPQKCARCSGTGDVPQLCYCKRSLQQKRLNMSYSRNNKTKLAAAVISIISLVAIALWQLNLFLYYRNSTGHLDMQAGINHLWLALGSAIISILTLFIVFSVLVHYDGDNERHIISRVKSWKISR
jgi:hypothetical protein